MAFNLALQFVLDHEGGYVHHPADPGGETNFGITKRVALAHGYRGPMRNLPLDLVRRIYRESYWDRCQCEALPEHALRLVVFDAAVNSGPRQSVRWLQDELARRAPPSVAVDGLIGPQTLAAAQALAAQPGALDALAAALIDRRERFLYRLPTWETFGRGWQRRLNDLRAVVRAK